MKEETKRLSLSECKDAVAKNHYYYNWQKISQNGVLDGVPEKWMDEAAEMYAAQSPLPESRVKPDKPDFGKLAEELWDNDVATNPHNVNPYAFRYGAIIMAKRIWRDYVELSGNSGQLESSPLKDREQLEQTRLHESAAELHSLKMSINESPLKEYFPSREMSFHDKVILAIHKLSHLKDREADEELEELRTYRHVSNESIAHLHRSNEELLEALKDASQYVSYERKDEFKAILEKHSSLVKKQP